MAEVESNKRKLRQLRIKAASRGILTIAELARRIPCSRISVYFALEKPSRFPRVSRRIKELTNA